MGAVLLVTHNVATNHAARDPYHFYHLERHPGYVHPLCSCWGLHVSGCPSSYRYENGPIAQKPVFGQHLAQEAELRFYPENHERGLLVDH